MPHPILFSDNDPTNWKGDLQVYATMPGYIAKLAVIDDEVWAACRMNRQWWQFWKPAAWIQWFKVPKPPSDSDPHP